MAIAIQPIQSIARIFAVYLFGRISFSIHSLTSIFNSTTQKLTYKLRFINLMVSLWRKVFCYSITWKMKLIVFSCCCVSVCLYQCGLVWRWSHRVHAFAPHHSHARLSSTLLFAINWCIEHSPSSSLCVIQWHNKVAFSMPAIW